MKKCLRCQNQVTSQKLFQNNVTICFRCYCVGFTQTTFEWLVDSSFIIGFKQSIKQLPSAPGKPCFFCSLPTRAIPVKLPTERADNLRIFSHWRYWYTLHRQGDLQIDWCPKCGSAWMNARTFCRLPIDWFNLENRFRDLQKTKEDESEFGLPTEPFHAIAVLFYGIPYLENIPTLSEMPYWTYISALSVGGITKLAFSHDNIKFLFLLDPHHPPINFLFTMFSYSWIHANWAHYLGNVAFFMIFSPLVEHELRGTRFLFLLLASAVGGAVLQTFLYPRPLLGLSGVVAGVISFFCCRFPTAVIGMGIVRFAAPTALLIYLFLDLKSVLEMFMHQGNVAGLAHLGGAGMGFLFHLLMPSGDSTKKFQKMSEQLLKQEKALKNWNK